MQYDCMSSIPESSTDEVKSLSLIRSFIFCFLGLQYCITGCFDHSVVLTLAKYTNDGDRLSSSMTNFSFSSRSSQQLHWRQRSSRRMVSFLSVSSRWSSTNTAQCHNPLASNSAAKLMWSSASLEQWEWSYPSDDSTAHRDQLQRGSITTLMILPCSHYMLEQGRALPQFMVKVLTQPNHEVAQLWLGCHDSAVQL